MEYIVTSPDGRKFRVKAPDGATQEQVLTYAKSQFSKMGPKIAQEQIAARRAQNPAEYDPESREFQLKYGPGRPQSKLLAPLGVEVAGRSARMLAQGLAAFPLAAADAGVALRNEMQPRPEVRPSDLITGNIPQRDQYELPSQMWNRALNDLIPAPPDLAGRVGEAVGGGLVGGRFIPNVQPQRVAPQAFQKPGAANAEVLKRGQEIGLVAPPSTTNPTALNRALEGFAGKISTAQGASVRTQAAATAAAKRHIGLSEDAPLTVEAIKAVRSEAAKSYEPVRQAGRIVADQRFKSEVSQLTARYKSAGKDFPELAKNEVDDLVKGLNKDEFSADSAVDLIKILRDNADDAFRSGKGQLGNAYREASKAVEGAIERHLAKGGKDSAAILSKFRKGRELIAKTYSVENALNPATQLVSPAKLGQQLKDKPLTGELKTVAEFAKAFPKASREINESLPGISPLDFYASGGVTALGYLADQDPSNANLLPLLYPFLRLGSRNALLGPMGQRLAVPSTPGAPSNALAGSYANILALLGQQGLVEE